MHFFRRLERKKNESIKGIWIRNRLCFYESLPDRLLYRFSGFKAKQFHNAVGTNS